jgi:hypothetical protein
VSHMELNINNGGMKKEDEEKAEVSFINTTESWIPVPQVPPLIQINNNMVTLPLQTIYEIGFEHLGPEILKRLKRKPQKLPITLNYRFHYSLYIIIFSNQEVILNNTEDIVRFFGEFSKKTFQQGSYALIQPPVKINYLINKRKIYITFYYSVYNKSHVLQWPEYYG